MFRVYVYAALIKWIIYIVDFVWVGVAVADNTVLTTNVTAFVSNLFKHST